MRTAVIIPAFNEELSICKVINDIPLKLVDEIVVVNNNSTDKTPEVASNCGATVLTESQKGYGAACLAGIEYCIEQKHELIVFLDGDYSDHPGEMSFLLDPILKDEMDFVLGSRVIGEREKGALPIQSRIGSIIAGFLMNLFWKVKYTDLGPFRAIRMDKLLQLNMQDKWFGWTVEMQIKAAMEKLRIKEVPVSYRKRIGKSKVTGTIRGTVMASVIILSTIFKYAFKNEK